MWLNLIIPPNPTWELFVLTASGGAPLEGATVPRSNPKLEPQEREVDGRGHSLLVFLLQISVTFPHNYRMQSWVSAKWDLRILWTHIEPAPAGVQDVFGARRNRILSWLSWKVDWCKVEKMDATAPPPGTDPKNMAPNPTNVNGRDNLIKIVN